MGDAVMIEQISLNVSNSNGENKKKKTRINGTSGGNYTEIKKQNIKV